MKCCCMPQCPWGGPCPRAPFPSRQPSSAPITYTFLVSPWEWWQDLGLSHGILPGWDLGCLTIFLYSGAHTITARCRKMMLRYIRLAHKLLLSPCSMDT